MQEMQHVSHLNQQKIVFHMGQKPYFIHQHQSARDATVSKPKGFEGFLAPGKSNSIDCSHAMSCNPRSSRQELVEFLPSARSKRTSRSVDGQFLLGSSIMGRNILICYIGTVDDFIYIHCLIRTQIGPTRRRSNTPIGTHRLFTCTDGTCVMAPSRTLTITDRA